MSLIQLTSEKEFDALIAREDLFLLYKFNPNNCRLSTKTRPIIEEATTLYQTPGYRIDVIASPELKMYIAQQTDTKHESPQLFIMKGKEVQAVTSHSHITLGWIESHLSN